MINPAPNQQLVNSVNLGKQSESDSQIVFDCATYRRPRRRVCDIRLPDAESQSSGYVPQNVERGAITFFAVCTEPVLTEANYNDKIEIIMSVSKRNLEFLELVGQLKHLKRKGWVLENVPDPESIASHMYRMAVMSFLIEPTSGIDRLRCMELALVHDLAECIVGDITPRCGISAEEKRKKELAAMERITRSMPTNGQYIRQLFNEYENQASSEAKLVKEFDRLDMIIQAFEYEKQGGSANVGRLEDFFASTEGKFTTPFVTSIVDELKLQRDSTKMNRTKLIVEDKTRMNS